MVEEEGRRRGGSPFAPLSLSLSLSRAGLTLPMKGVEKRGHAYGALAPD